MIRAAALGCVALAGCSAEPEPSSNAVTIAVPGPAAPIVRRPLAPGELAAPELDGAVAVPGQWEFKASATGSAALFGQPGGDASFTIRCDPQARRIVFARAGAAPPGTMLRIVTLTGAAAYPINASSDGLPLSEARASIDDRFVAATLARAEGPIGVRVGDGETLAVPSDTAIARVIESCRRL